MISNAIDLSSSSNFLACCRNNPSLPGLFFLFEGLVAGGRRTKNSGHRVSMHIS